MKNRKGRIIKQKNREKKRHQAVMHWGSFFSSLWNIFIIYLFNFFLSIQNYNPDRDDF